MPEICRFNGIRITMFVGNREHPPPHFHAQHGDHRAVFDIETASMMNGTFPRASLRLVEQWCSLHRAELEENWRLARAARPLITIQSL